MTKFKVGDPFDIGISGLQKSEIYANLEGIAYSVEERSYTKNLTDDELNDRKDEYSKVGIKLSELNDSKAKMLADFKDKTKEPQLRSSELIEAIKYKSEQRYGALFLIDDQENGMMNVFDTSGICVETRPLSRKERQLTLKVSNNE